MNIVERANKIPQSFVDAAKKAQKATGCLSSVTLAQAILESGWFHSTPPCSNNYFGIKAIAGQPYVMSPTTEERGGRIVYIIAKFAKYPSIEAGFEAHAKLLMNPTGPYKDALLFKNNWCQFVQKIAPIYATDPHYASKVIGLIQTWNLIDFDV